MPVYNNFGLTPSLEGATMFEQDGSTIEYNTMASSSAGENVYTYNFQSFYSSVTSNASTTLFSLDARKTNFVEVLYYTSIPTLGSVINQSNYLSRYKATIGLESISSFTRGAILSSEYEIFVSEEGTAPLYDNIVGLGDIELTSPPLNNNQYIIEFQFTANAVSSLVRGIYQYI